VPDDVQGAASAPVARPLPQPFEWLFRNRVTGRITVAQAPNLPLCVFIGAVVVRRLADPEGTAGAAVDVVAGVALAAWAVDEIVRGVNPWRRILGATVLAATVAGVVLR
jgi:hypothetical protein